MEGRKITGNRGEDEACRYLQGIGHCILARNWRSGHLELDIVSRDACGLHFVEVKTRRAPASAEPQENVGALKRKRLVCAARAFLNSGTLPHGSELEAFFDVISVLLDGDDATIEYYPQAFIPIYV